MLHYAVVFGCLLSSNRRARISGFLQKWILLIHFSSPPLGVDPAKPLIRNRASGRLDAGDADVVQILHATARYGDLKRMGHVDFCLNGGHVQPFCTNVSSEWRRFFFNYDFVLLFCTFFIFDTSNRSIVPTLCCHLVFCERTHITREPFGFEVVSCRQSITCRNIL